MHPEFYMILTGVTSIDDRRLNITRFDFYTGKSGGSTYNSDKSGLKRLWRETVCQSQLGRGCDGLVKGWVGSLPPGDNGPGDYP